MCRCRPPRRLLRGGERYSESVVMQGTPDELEHLRSAAAHAEQRLQLLEHERAGFERLSVVARRIAAELDHRRLAQLVVDAATELTGAGLGAFFYSVTDDRVESYMLYATAGVPRDAFAQLPLPRNTELLAPTFLGQAVVRLADVTDDPRYGKSPPHRGLPEGHPEVHSYLAVPVLSSVGAPIGGLFLGHIQPGRFTEQAER